MRTMDKSRITSIFQCRKTLRTASSLEQRDSGAIKKDGSPLRKLVLPAL